MKVTSIEAKVLYSVDLKKSKLEIFLKLKKFIKIEKMQEFFKIAIKSQMNKSLQMNKMFNVARICVCVC